MNELSSARGVLAEHQLQLVEQVSSTRGSGRFLIKAPPGSGKSVAAAVSLGRIMSSTVRPKALVLTTPAYLLHWQDVLHRWANVRATLLDGPTYRMNQARYGSPWGGGSVFVVSMDFLKTSARADDALTQNWDFVLFDEVEAASDRSARGRLARRLWRSADVRVAVASSTLPEPAWLARDPNVLRFDWGDVLRDLSSGVDFRTVRFRLTAAERRFMRALQDTGPLRPEERQQDFIEGLLLRLAGSSFYAVESALRLLQLRSRLQSRLTLSEKTLGKSAPLGIESGAIYLEEELTIDRAMQGRVVYPLARIESLLSLLEAIEGDSKWERCAEFLEELDPNSQTIIIFCEFTDTADLVHNLSAGLGWTTYRLTTLQSAEMRWASVEAASQRPAILVVTSALASTLGVPVGSVIHYDLPAGGHNLARQLDLRPRYPSFAPVAENYVLLESGTTDSVLQQNLSRMLPEGARVRVR